MCGSSLAELLNGVVWLSTWLPAHQTQPGWSSEPSVVVKAFPSKGFGLCSCIDLMSFMLRSLFSLVFAAVMWVQVPQWKADWSKCAVDVPDVSCHWYVVAPDNTFGEGFDWASAPWFDANGLQDVAKLENTMQGIHQAALASS